MPDNDVRQPIVSIVSTGQMGAAAAAGARLKTNGVRVITPEGRSEASAARARAAGIEIVPLTEIGASDFVFLIVAPAVAVETAQEVGAVLHKGTNRPLYIDWNAVCPARAQEVENIISAAGGGFADGGIIGAPKADGPGPLLFASGTVTTYQYSPGNGALTPIQIVSSLPPDIDTSDSHASEIEVNRTGRFVYASNRAPNSIAVFRINERTGHLTFVCAEPTLAQAPPRD